MGEPRISGKRCTYTYNKLTFTQHDDTITLQVYYYYTLTLVQPRMTEMMFRHTGRRMRIMLKLIGKAGPLANAKAS